MTAGLTVPANLWQEMVRHVEACMPEEACGFLAGSRGLVSRVIPVENVDHSPVRFRMEPRGQLSGMRQMEEQGTSMLAIYHSHPSGPRGLSTTDLAEAAYPETALVVLTPGSGEWFARAFVLEGRSAREIPFTVEAASGVEGDTG